MLSFHFSQSVEEAFLIFPCQQRGTSGKRAVVEICEMSENLAVRSLCPMRDHF